MPYWETYLHPWINIVNVEQKWAVIPGDGSAEAHFITTQDMARFVARLQDLELWSDVTFIAGDKVSLQKLVEIAEEARSKFLIMKILDVLFILSLMMGRL